jgi:SAM-dependent methyltransferase
MLGLGRGAPEPGLALADTSVPLPAGAEQDLRADHPRLEDLRRRYAGVGLPASRWTPERVEGFLDLRWFRGESLITWHYREDERVTRLKYFLLLEQVAARDRLGLLRALGEDGAFGCFTYEFDGRPAVSRDLLDSVAELNFLDARAALGAGTRVLDIGAGYGRLAHRATTAFPGIADYCCTDAVPESTFVCDYYLRHRGCMPPARVVALDEVGALEPGSFDLAVNVHSWPEAPLEAVAWWLRELERLRVPRLFVVPNDGERLLSLEPDGERRDFRPLIDAAGYRLVAREPVLPDAAARDLLDMHDEFLLFER